MLLGWILNSASCSRQRAAAERISKLTQVGRSTCPRSLPTAQWLTGVSEKRCWFILRQSVCHPSFMARFCLACCFTYICLICALDCKKVTSLTCKQFIPLRKQFKTFKAIKEFSWRVSQNCASCLLIRLSLLCWLRSFARRVSQNSPRNPRRSSRHWPTNDFRGTMTNC